MTINEQPELDPKPMQELPAVQARLKPHFSTVPNAREKTTSKKVDDPSNLGAKSETAPQVEHGHKPEQLKK